MTQLQRSFYYIRVSAFQLEKKVVFTKRKGLKNQNNHTETQTKKTYATHTKPPKTPNTTKQDCPSKPQEPDDR